MLSVVDCCLRSGAVKERSVLVCGFRWMRLLKWAGEEVDRGLKVNNAILKVIFACMEANEVE